MLFGILQIIPVLLCASYECEPSTQSRTHSEESYIEQQINDKTADLVAKGLAYEKGDGVEVDYAKAKAFYEEAALLGSVQAIHNLGGLYNWGMGVEENRAVALDFWEEAAGAGNMYSSFNMANAFLNGNGRQRNEDRALEYYLASFEQGYEPAICQYGDIMSRRYPDDVLRIVELMENAALNGEALCIRAISWLLFEGFDKHSDAEKLLHWVNYGVSLNNAEATYVKALIYDFDKTSIDSDPEIAKQYYLKAAELGRESAFANLGFMYEEGKFGHEDPISAKYYYEQAIEADETWGYNNLATFYYRGTGKEVNYEKARELYEIAAKRGNSYAYSNLGGMYAYGNGVEVDAYKAESLYKKSIELGFDKAKIYLAELYLNQELSIFNRALALDYLYEAIQDGEELALERLAEQFKDEERKWFVTSEGDAQIAFDLAAHYVEADNIAEACNWYLVAFERKHDEAYLDLLDCVKDNKLANSPFTDHLEVATQWAEHQEWDADSLIGELFYYGISVTTDKSKAAEYFHAAHQNSGDSIAQYKLGVMYLEGDGVSKDEAAGRKFLELSSEQGVSAAFKQLSEVYRKGKGVPVDLTKAFAYAKTGAEYVDDVDATYQYAEMLLNGEGTEKNIALAIDWFDRAIQLGHCKAQCALGNVLAEFPQNQEHKSRAVQLQEFCTIKKPICSNNT